MGCAASSASTLAARRIQFSQVVPDTELQHKEAMQSDTEPVGHPTEAWRDVPRAEGPALPQRPTGDRDTGRTSQEVAQRLKTQRLDQEYRQIGKEKIWASF
eukprot:TRINITY_DN21241_c0_g2_i1.p1 TRINITY_DN21241_c0_g2~~TRINITY_DN21241_c0_g2_i1.p1  ORF type:complete len:101 (+),score=11.55 TRINITY_DN21241_c0_g2_i1:45-347(+)